MRFYILFSSSFPSSTSDAFPQRLFTLLCTVKVNKANRLRTQLLGRSSTSGDALSGISTSLSFTPVQGLEIATPSLSAAERMKAANDRWFQVSSILLHPSLQRRPPFLTLALFPPLLRPVRFRTLLDRAGRELVGFSAKSNCAFAPGLDDHDFSRTVGCLQKAERTV